MEKPSSQERSTNRFSIRHPLVLPVVGFIFIFLVGLASYVSFSGTTVGAADTRIVKVIEKDEQRTVPTRAKTVGELLDRLDLKLAEQDKVTPAIDTPIVEDNLEIAIYRARPVAIVDNGVRSVILSAELSPREAVKNAGIEVYNEDAVELRQSTDNLTDGLVAEELVIERSYPIKANIYGVISEYRTRAKTMADFLTEKNINLNEGDTTQPEERDAPIAAGQFISVNTKGKQTAAVIEQIPFTSRVETDPTLTAGQTNVKQAGQAGERAVVYELTIENGVEVSRRPLQTITTREPVEEIRVRGTKAIATYSVGSDRAELMRAAGISEDQFASVDYIIQKESGWRPGAINAIGCIGLGQRCPNGGSNALAQACPNWQTDPVCQLRHFSAYANGRYGSWNAAYQVWVVQRWW